MSAREALNELVVSMAVQKIFDIYNEENKTSFQAVDMGGVFPTFKDFKERFLSPMQQDNFKIYDSLSPKQKLEIFDVQTKSLNWKYSHEIINAFMVGEEGCIINHIETMLQGYRFLEKPIERITFNDDFKNFIKYLDHQSNFLRKKAIKTLGSLAPSDPSVHSKLIKAFVNDPMHRLDIIESLSQIEDRVGISNPNNHLKLIRYIKCLTGEEKYDAVKLIKKILKKQDNIQMLTDLLFNTKKITLFKSLIENIDKLNDKEFIDILEKIK